MNNIDWNNLIFGYTKTDYNVRFYYRDGKWSPLEISTDDHISIHISATCLHYGQEAFEGLKAFRGKDGKVRIFRMRDNAERLIESARGILMAELPVALFEEAALKVVELNKEYIPPYGTGASLYLRPLLIGTSPRVGVKPSDEYTFLIFASPVGPYFKEGFKPTPMVIMPGYDRAAPLGTGKIKVGGNYAASLRSGEIAHHKGYSAVIYLDAKEKKYIDECGPANFFAIKDNTYVTPKSDSVLPSITNKSLMTLAADMGLTVEERRIPVDELSSFTEAGACGTAAVISPIERIDYWDDADAQNPAPVNIATYGKPGKYSTALYNRLRGIQYGEEEDLFGWNTVINI